MINNTCQRSNEQANVIIQAKLVRLMNLQLQEALAVLSSFAQNVPVTRHCCTSSRMLFQHATITSIHTLMYQFSRYYEAYL